MRKAFLAILATSLALALVGCNKEEAAATTAAPSGSTAVPGKGTSGGNDISTAEMLPGPGAAEAESRAGSKLGGR